MRRRLPHPRHIALAAFCVAGALFILSPLAIVILTSFSATAYNVFPPQEYSLRWYETLAAQAAFYGAAVRSVVLASATMAIALVIGTLASYALVKYALRGRDLIKGLLLAPIVLPNIVLGVALFIFFVRIGTVNSYPSLLITHVLVVTPLWWPSPAPPSPTSTGRPRRRRWTSAPGRSRPSCAWSCRRSAPGW
jgi:ABC-type spermidine/putrescine transport system, permease component II